MSRYLPGWFNFILYLPILCIAILFAFIRYCLLSELQFRGGRVVSRYGQASVLAFQNRPDRLVLVFLYEPNIAGESVFQASWLLRRMAAMLRAAGIPELPPDDSRLQAAVRRWGLRFEADQVEQLNELGKNVSRLWRKKPDEREDVLRLALWYALARDRLMSKDQGGLGGFLERVLN